MEAAKKFEATLVDQPGDLVALEGGKGWVTPIAAGNVRPQNEMFTSGMQRPGGRQSCCQSQRVVPSRFVARGYVARFDVGLLGSGVATGAGSPSGPPACAPGAHAVHCFQVPL